MKLGKAAALTAMTLTSLVAVTAANATPVPVNTWAHWQSNSTSGNITFSSGQQNATWNTSGDNGYSTDVSNNTSSEYFDATTPVAQAFSTNGPSTRNNFMKLIVPAGDGGAAYLFVNFANPVPAGDLAIVVSDIDSDEVLIDGRDAADNLMTVSDMKGDAGTNLSDVAFNFCAHRTTSPCSNDTQTVPVTSTSGTQIKFGDRTDQNLWGTDGSSAWLHPSVSVKSLRFQVANGDPNNESSERIWIVQRNLAEPSSNSGSLANTGLDSLTWTTAGAAMIGTGYALTATVRRRRARK